MSEDKDPTVGEGDNLLWLTPKLYDYLVQRYKDKGWPFPPHYRRQEMIPMPSLEEQIDKLEDQNLRHILHQMLDRTSLYLPRPNSKHTKLHETVLDYMTKNRLFMVSEIEASLLTRLDFQRKQLYNVLGYLNRIGMLRRKKYGVYEVVPQIQGKHADLLLIDDPLNDPKV